MIEYKNYRDGDNEGPNLHCGFGYGDENKG